MGLKNDAMMRFDEEKRAGRTKKKDEAVVMGAEGFKNRVPA